MKRLIFSAMAAIGGTFWLAQAQPPEAGFDSLPRPWTRATIGRSGVPGKAVFHRKAFVISGEGRDIWDSADNCEFVWQDMEGDGALIARLVTMQNTHDWAKAGVMLREDLGAGSRNVAVVVNPQNGVWLQRRRKEQNYTEEVFGEALHCPIWIGLEREGDTIGGYQSQDGKTWKRIGLTILRDLPKTLRVGLAVCSNNPGTPNRCEFDTVTRLDKIPTK